ncbi:putative clathrin assembly protein At2g01600 isoform X2 [Physcomitrium patens]|nr:putative clathrin assembly protein At4g25940 isoform X2 [Physcomitrium patens]|eukprot:XP_024402711.1 putative clathrin assembly protein At4g25940 isoform X2 [Physcomitrella patens]
MMVIHRTLREGDPTFREELINYGRNRGHILNLSNFKDDSSPHAWDYSAWVRTYALFLEERLECFRVLKYDVESERPTGHSRTRELDTVELLEHLPALQQLLFRLMGCQPEGAAISNYVIQAALGLVLKESFKLYRAINDGIINLVDKFFEMQRHDAVKALEIYKRAGQQAERLSDFYEVCKGLDLARSFQFPTLEQPPQSFLTTMEDYVKEAPRAGATLMLKNEPEYGERSPPRALEEPAPPSYKEEDYEEEPKASVPVPEKEPEPAPEPAVVEPMGNLLDLDSDLPNASALEEANALALAIIPDGQSANGNAGPTFDVNDPAGWELALVTNPTDSATAATKHNNLAGGFDKLTLDSLYDDALHKRGANGAVPNSYNMGMNGSGPNPFQGPGMPPQHMDPFMASGQYAPTTNVQMQMMQQQQAMMMQQQQQQVMGMGAGTPIPFGNANPFGGPVGGTYPYGAPQPAPVPGQLALPAPPPAYSNPFGNPGLL